MSECTWKVGETYKLRDGREAIVLGAHEGRLFGRSGSITGVGWVASDWCSDTGFWTNRQSDYDLMPPPASRVTRKVWLNVYPDGAGLFLTRYAADCLSDGGRVACVCVDLDIADGYGLDKDQPAILVRAG